MPTPTHYKCQVCGAAGVKLWREYNTFLNHQRLLCRDCAEKDQAESLQRLYGPGSILGDYSEACDQISSLIPAVPDLLPKGPEWKLTEGYTFWGYTSVPDAEVKWWKSLKGQGSAVGAEMAKRVAALVKG